MANPIILPLIPLKGLVVFPFMILHFDVGRQRSIEALERAMQEDQRIFLVAQKNVDSDNPSEKDIFKVGTVSIVKQILKLPGGGARILVEGAYRAEIKEYIENKTHASVRIVRIPQMRIKMDIEKEALLRLARELFDDYCEMNNRMPPDAILSVMNVHDMGHVADIIASNTSVKTEDKQAILATRNPQIRLEQAIQIMQKETEILSVEREIALKVREKMDQQNRNYFLREQLKVIERELGDADGNTEEIAEYRRKLGKLKMKKEYHAKVEKEINRLAKGVSNSTEADVIRTYLDAVLELPWHVKTKSTASITKAAKILDKDHYGLVEVKERIIEFLAVRKLKRDSKGQILCFIGPPGVGKTSIAKSIAEAMNMNFARVSLGGVRDEAEIRGHRKTYVAAMPGRIIKAIAAAGSNNPVILLDEIDKMGNDFKGDPASAMLEVLDSEQNHAFRDHYLELSFDLSQAFFIATANSADQIPKPLLDRMEIIKMHTYTAEEKAQIAIRYLIPKQLELHGILPGQLTIQTDAIHEIINYYTREAGVRGLERQIAKICRKVAKNIVESKEQQKVKVGVLNVERHLGKRKFHIDMIGKHDEIGVATGLAWTPVGGETLPIEVNVMSGSGKLELTGHLGDVMKESAKAAISYIRTKVADIGVEENFYKEKDIHIHVPEGATPKDGPSAGIAMATALISALTQIPVRKDVAMTGEITLRGRVLPIGGLKEKTLAAHRMGIKTVIIPHENERDIEKIPENVASEIQFVLASSMDEVTANALNIRPFVDNNWKRRKIRLDFKNRRVAVYKDTQASRFWKAVRRSRQFGDVSTPYWHRMATTTEVTDAKM